MSAAEQQEFVAAQLARPVGDDIHAMAEAVRAKYPVGAVAAIVGYGSCLRDVSSKDSLIDFYVLVHRPDQVSQSRLGNLACRLLPPNVYYAECDGPGYRLRAKYAVVDIERFGKWLSPATANPYFWARFSQPAALVWCDSPQMRQKVIAQIVTAISTMYGFCRGNGGGREGWVNTLVRTYNSELRAEGPGRAHDIVAHNAAYYDQVARVFGDVPELRANWGWRGFTGKLLAVLRLVKASFTFDGGADYLAWKISRHSGVEVKLRDWQRRHPVLAAIYLLPALLRKGAVK